MVNYRFIKLAKQGNYKAIATLLNGKLHPQGISAKANVVNGWLHILLESEQLPDRRYVVDVVRNQLIELAPESVKKVKLLIKRYSDDYATWGQEFDFKLNSFPSLKWQSFSDNQQNGFTKNQEINRINNAGESNIRMSQMTLAIVVVILLMALVVFLSRILIKQSSQTPDSSTTYPQLLGNANNLI